LHGRFTINERAFEDKNKCSSDKMATMSAEHVALRPALELAFLVAVVGSRQRPPLAAPASLRPFLRSQKLSIAAQEPLVAAVESDVDFRLRVLAVADEATVGAAGMLWLSRPDDWQRELAALLEETPTDGAGDHRLVRAQKALRDTKATLAAVKVELSTAQRSLKDAKVVAAKAERTRAGMEQEIAGLSAKLARSEADRGSLLRELRELSDIIDRKDDEAAEREAELAAGPWDAVFIPDPDTVDFTRLSADLTSAEDANMALAEALAVVRRSLYRPENAAPGRTASVVQLVPPLASQKKSSKAPRKKRHRLRLPGGVLNGSIEEAKFLIANTDLAMVVDGYNVAKLAFPRASLIQQREQLLDIADEIQARFGTQILVVFDGADIGPTAAPRHRVAVKFSAAGVTADDLIVSWVTAEPLDQAVVVVTSDNAVRNACNLLGTHLLHSAAFLAAAGRRSDGVKP
jgi:YacP-like NYN domain